jgi:hypothetical protein
VILDGDFLNGGFEFQKTSSKNFCCHFGVTDPAYTPYREGEESK